MRFIRKQVTVEAVQLTRENLEEVRRWSGGRIQVELTGVQHPPLEVVSNVRNLYSEWGWWLLVHEDGTLEVMPEIRFEQTYQKT